jgi:two-component system, chemotaxis family, sensor kinase CheA
VAEIDDLIDSFWRTMPDRITQATELWLGAEKGDVEQLPELRRLMHSIKGEAQMLGLEPTAEVAEAAEAVVDSILEVETWPEQIGNALLGAFEAFSMLSPDVGAGVDVPGTVKMLTAARVRVEKAGVKKKKAGKSKAAKAPARAAEEQPVEVQAEAAASQSVAVDELEPVVNELRRLYSEQAVLYPQLRAVQNQLRKLLRQIDPNASPEQLAENIVKTLGFGAELERRLGALASEWSATEFLSTVTLDQLEALVRRASVVPLSRLEAQIHRSARTAAHMLDKKVDVRLEGNAMLDAAIERRLSPAIMHLVRNSVDHGIEDAALRVGLGKPERGSVVIKVTQAESTVRVVVEDDGGGVQFDRLRARLARTRPDANQLSETDLLRVIFEHGVTARDEVTPLSGRGVGLDVVASEVTALGGRVHCESTPGVGTRFVLVLPSSLRVDTVMPITAGTLRCAVPSHSVRAVTRVAELNQTTEGPMTRVTMGETSELVRIRSLSALLGQKGEPRIGEAAVVLETPRGSVAVTVDNYGNPRPLVTQPVQDAAVQTPLVRGVAPTPDGDVLLILDVAAIFDAVARSSKGTTEKQESRRHHVLVVEDAPVARELLSGILRSFGLRVSEAMDGEQGLLIAQRDRPDLILTDIEMPVMTGLQMMARIRQDPGLRDLPIVVLTTRSDEETRRQAEALGVRSFLSKRKFVERELRTIIESTLGGKST